MHAWSEKVFLMLGSCLGQVVEIDADAVQRRRVDVVWVQLHCKSVSDLPRIVELDVDNIRFNVLVVVGEESTSLCLLLQRQSQQQAQRPHNICYDNLGILNSSKGGGNRPCMGILRRMRKIL